MRNGNRTFTATATDSVLGARPHQVVREVQANIRAGHGWVVDMDLQAFFDRVNHDRLIARLKQRGINNRGQPTVSAVPPAPTFPGML